MPRGIYPRKKVVQDYANPVQVLADEVVAMRKKAMTDGKLNKTGNKQLILARNKKRLITMEDEQLRMENEQMKEYLSTTRRVLGDRVNTLILLLENLKASL